MFSFSVLLKQNVPRPKILLKQNRNILIISKFKFLLKQNSKIAVLLKQNL